MNTNTIAKLSQIVFALVMIFFGIGHFTSAEKMVGAVPTYIPGGVIWVYLTGIGLLLSGVSLIIGKQAQLASYLLGGMLLVFVLTIHLPALMNAADEGAKTMAMMGMTKDLALAAAAFFIGTKNT